MAKKKYNSDEILKTLTERANINGYSLIVNGSKKEELNLILFPYKTTIVSQEAMARILHNILTENNVTESKQMFANFKHDIEPDDMDEFVFVTGSPEKPETETHISIFHNKNILYKHIIMKL